VSLCMRVYMCIYVCERDTHTHTKKKIVCVCERERERETERVFVHILTRIYTSQGVPVVPWSGSGLKVNFDINSINNNNNNNNHKTNNNNNDNNNNNNNEEDDNKEVKPDLIPAEVFQAARVDTYAQGLLYVCVCVRVCVSFSHTHSRTHTLKHSHTHSSCQSQIDWLSINDQSK